MIPAISENGIYEVTDRFNMPLKCEGIFPHQIHIKKISSGNAKEVAALVAPLQIVF